MSIDPWTGKPRAQLCSCGSGEYREAAYDARNIFITYVCSRCRKDKLKGYRTEVLTDPNYDHCEDIDGDEEMY